MPLYRLQAALQDISNLPRDEYVNTLFVTKATAADVTSVDNDADHLKAAIQAFYQTLSRYLSKAIIEGGALHSGTVKMYQHDLPLHSPPIASKVFDVTSIATTGLGVVGQTFPNEVACCLSFHAVPRPGTGWHPQSWRGRFYVGPLSGNTTSDEAGPGTGRPGNAFMSALLGAGVALDTAIHAAGFDWVVYSRKHSEVMPIASLSVDDAWDTQRSRGLRRTVVNTLPVTHAVAAAGPA